MMDLHKIIQDALYEFLQSYIPNADISTLDEVLLSYITGVLEDLGSQGSVEENFDVEDFVEMLEAYIPGFGEIDNVKVCEMMFSLAAKLASARVTETTVPKRVESNWSLTHSSSNCETLVREVHFLSPDGATAQIEQDNLSELDSQEQLLLEMFPKCSMTEARSALSIAKGDIEEAVRLIIEGDVQLCPTPPVNANQGKTPSVKAARKMKESILEKYMMVDSEEDKKTHRPVTPKDAPKKLVRYHDNQVVTTKGERYHQVKKEETEDMKKTYVSLKPSRKYRFH
ncbi:CUE domain-containing protein 2 [Clupea harengus]|uniref:CUE domain-containing protein 2 n=1 Tax=Clupea harengus TaxID=7950 RepID=A0A6P8GIM1_CLUHA|nr:CUE domain-containing protein 2 [Clupea harengus]XP_012694336.1 CUE domain-containing protein 2 [Clupea harengus]XP_031434724.1 CUE domain-containing protein 2 [Clupea harengus]XP_031434725.1 CUE domain-containing protein 2 [Clupea harengus]